MKMWFLQQHVKSYCSWLMIHQFLWKFVDCKSVREERKIN
jgi:hypothetical protein